MKLLLTSTALIVGLIASAGVYAVPPAGATGLCKDGTYHTGANKKGACRGHKGIQEWYATTDIAAAPSAPAVAAPKPVKKTAATPVFAASAAPAGATGLCNDGSYHTGANKQGACRGHKGIKDWYGATAAAPAAAKTAPASASSAAPAGATGVCNDGSYHTGANKQGACRGHKGIKDWYGANGAGSAATVPAAESAPAKKGMFSFLNKKPAETAVAPAAAATHAAVPVAAGGGAGKVWLNTDSQIYHCQTSHWYGKTKTGQYMTEAAAKAAGARPDHGKACI